MTVQRETRTEQALNLTVAIPPQQTTGPYDTEINVRTYPAIYSRSILRRLQSIHPLIATIASAVTGIASLYLVYFIFFDGGTPLRPSERRRVPRRRSQ